MQSSKNVEENHFDEPKFLGTKCGDQFGSLTNHVLSSEGKDQAGLNEIQPNDSARAYFLVQAQGEDSNTKETSPPVFSAPINMS